MALWEIESEVRLKSEEEFKMPSGAAEFKKYMNRIDAEVKAEVEGDKGRLQKMKDAYKKLAKEKEAYRKSQEKKPGLFSNIHTQRLLEASKDAER
jgi:hypothetical protein